MFRVWHTDILQKSRRTGEEQVSDCGGRAQEDPRKTREDPRRATGLFIGCKLLQKISVSQTL